MINYGNWVWEGTSLETKPGVAEGAGDGHVFKELDTGESYTRVNGTWVFINLGLSFIKATKSGLITTDAKGFCRVTFVTPFFNSSYTINLSVKKTPKPYMACWDNIDINGFDVYTRDTRNGIKKGLVDVAWLATRNYDP